MTIGQITYSEFLEGFRRCYSLDFQNILPLDDDFKPAYNESTKEFNIEILKDLAKNSNSNFFKSIALRIELVNNLRKSRYSSEIFDLKYNWNLLYNSISSIETNSIISSIGSQGFLSIPIYKYDSNMSDFEFYRFHIWHKDLEEYFDVEKSRKFSIHSHSFLASSWILSGNILNERYLVQNTDNDSESSLFKIQYNKSLNEVNEHTSSAVNTGNKVRVLKTSIENHLPNAKYSIEPGEFHRSDSEGKNGLSATLFCFSTKEEVVKSFVTGPTSVSESKINRKMYVDPSKYLRELKYNISNNE